MAGATRREKLEQMLQAEPDDEFLRYGLAGEYDNEGRIDEAVALYRGLMAGNPPHVPSYFRCAQLFVREERIDEARGLLRDGIEAARWAGDAHAAGEMAELLASLGTLGK
jgi:tetratricopeptide (TPR) repeat protein